MSQYNRRVPCLEFLRKMVSHPGDVWAIEVDTLCLILWKNGYSQETFRDALVEAMTVRNEFRVSILKDADGNDHRRVVYEFANIGPDIYQGKEFIIDEQHTPSAPGSRKLTEQEQ